MFYLPLWCAWLTLAPVVSRGVVEMGLQGKWGANDATNQTRSVSSAARAGSAHGRDSASST